MFLNLSTGVLAGVLTLAVNPGPLGWLGFAACMLFAVCADTA